jgi:HPt (histidine-containing phosphotransfer) domain-containing protein
MAATFPDSSTLQKIAALWQRSQPQILDRLALLDRAAAAAAAGDLTPELRKEATTIAHKLAGSLGVFGFHEGTDIARRIEHQLEADGPASQPADPELLAGRAAQLRHALFPNPGS